MTDLRPAWSDYKARPQNFTTVNLGGDLLQIASPLVDAVKAMDMVLDVHGFKVDPGITSSYANRNIRGGSTPSWHKFAAAIDINSKFGPLIKTPSRRKIRFATGATQEARRREQQAGTADTAMTKAMVDDIKAIRTRTGRQVWSWGGDWRSIKDGMHFEASGITPVQLEVGIDWSTVASGTTWQPDDTNFDRCLEWLGPIEGGFVNNPNDTGGATNHGVTRKVLAQWRGKAVSVADVRALTKAEAKLIYKGMFWQENNINHMPLPIALLMFNSSVHNGPDRAAKFLQTSLNQQGAGLDVDGDIGPKTLQALNKANIDTLSRALFSAYDQYLRNHPQWSDFPGWLTRLNKLETTTAAWLAEWKSKAPTKGNNMSIGSKILPILLTAFSGMNGCNSAGVATGQLDTGSLLGGLASSPETALIGIILAALLGVQVNGGNTDLLGVIKGMFGVKTQPADPGGR